MYPVSVQFITPFQLHLGLDCKLIILLNLTNETIHIIGTLLTFLQIQKNV